MKNIIYILACIIMYSCSPKPIEKPANFISKEKMVALLVDMKIAAKTKNFKNKKLRKGKNYMAYVYEKHQIDSTQFKENNAYYVHNIELYQEIYDEVYKRLKDSLAKYEKKKKENDSILKVKQIKLDKKLLNKPTKGKKNKVKRPSNLSLDN